MKTESILGTASILAAAALPRHRFIGFDGNLCGANAKARGVSAMAIDAGQQCPINISGEVLVESGGEITAGQEVVSDATGKAVAATDLSATVPAGATPVTSSGAQPAMTIAGSVVPQKINGVAVDAATAAGQFIRVKVI